MPNYYFTPSWYYTEGQCIKDLDDCYGDKNDDYYIFELESREEILEAIQSYKERLAELKSEEENGDPDAWYYIGMVQSDLKKLYRRLNTIMK